MQYKNLRSLSKAYSYGSLDRESYLRNRRQIIDDTVAGLFDDGAEDTVIGLGQAAEDNRTARLADCTETEDPTVRSVEATVPDVDVAAIGKPARWLRALIVASALIGTSTLIYLLIASR